VVVGVGVGGEGSGGRGIRRRLMSGMVGRRGGGDGEEVLLRFWEGASGTL